MQTSPSSNLEHAVDLERKAHDLRAEKKIEEAFSAYDKAAHLYSKAGEHLKAALCFASAATCWNIHTGIQPLRNAATRTQQAALEAVKAESYHYARSLFLDAALLFEKEGDFGNYSTCFYSSKQAEAKHMWAIFVHGRNEAMDLTGVLNWKDRFSALGKWLINGLNFIVWGYGEKPFRTLVLAFGIIVLSGAVYAVSGKILVQHIPHSISFLEGLYMSVMTYTTVGFGDYLPLGWTRVFAVIEALLGIFLAPLFLVGLTSCYLRMYP